MTEEFEDMIEEVEDEVVEESQSSADPINTEEVVEEDELIVTDEMLDTIADTAIAALQDILQYFNVGEVTIDEYEGDEGELILDISGKDMAVLIGRHGKTLDALQFIVSMITVRTIGFRYPVIVDVEGYKNRQRRHHGAVLSTGNANHGGLSAAGLHLLPHPVQQTGQLLLRVKFHTLTLSDL